METSINLLLVEDDLMLAAIEKKQLNGFGYAIRHVTSGEDAVDVGLSDPSIDLILMDINLSTQMDGTQAAELILSQRDVPILFLSSHTEPEVVDLTEKISSYGYVVKNSGITVLDASIKMALKL
jgi:CheY-like chemotaxis protein